MAFVPYMGHLTPQTSSRFWVQTLKAFRPSYVSGSALLLRSPYLFQLPASIQSQRPTCVYIPRVYSSYFRGEMVDPSVISSPVNILPGSTQSCRVRKLVVPSGMSTPETFCVSRIIQPRNSVGTANPFLKRYERVFTSKDRLQTIDIV